MDKREFNAAMVAVSIAVLGITGAAAMLAHVAGPEAGGALLLASAVALGVVSWRAYSRAGAGASEEVPHE